LGFLAVLWDYILISAPFLMLGLIAGGLINEFLPFSKVKEWFGKGSLSGVFKASLLGVPLPLCSCSVIPAAVTLKKNGASNGATSSFLISTPETGLDSISVTYAMMDLPMTIIRPIAAFFTAFVAGVLQIIFNETEPMKPEVTNEEKSEEAPATSSCCASKKASVQVKPFSERVKSVLTYAFSNLLEDIAKWLLLGLVLGALITYFVPADLFLKYNGPYVKLLILLVGIPLYICASATTPIAASLVLKGMSPGTALLLLMVGPATNASNIIVLQKYIGKKGVALNVVAIAIVGIIFSYGVDFLYTKFQWALDFKIAHQHEHEASWVVISIAIIFLILHGRALYVEEIKPLFAKKKGCCSHV
jgi:uncharacterized protein